MKNQAPRLMTVRQVAQTGILPEHALRALLRSGKIGHRICKGHITDATGGQESLHQL